MYIIGGWNCIDQFNDVWVLNTCQLNDDMKCRSFNCIVQHGNGRALRRMAIVQYRVEVIQRRQLAIISMYSEAFMD